MHILFTFRLQIVTMETVLTSLVLCSLQLISAGNNGISIFSHEDFLKVVQIHDAFCTQSGVCVNSSGDVNSYASGNVFDSGGNTIVNKTIFPDWFENLPVLPRDTPSTVCCQPCSCDLTWCIPRGICCLDDFLPTIEESLSNILTPCVPVQLRTDLPSNSHHTLAYNMYTSCQHGYQPTAEMLQDHGNIVGKCEGREATDELNTNVPVTVIDGRYVFRNRYCAYCNYVEDANIVYFQIEIECINEMFQPSRLNTLVIDIKRTETCNLVYRWPSIVNVSNWKHACDKDIDACNVTGLWTEYDPLIEAACHAYASRYCDTYANVFCYLCNTDDMYTKSDYECTSSYLDGYFPAFSSLIKFSPDQSTDQQTMKPKTLRCTTDELYDDLVVSFILIYFRHYDENMSHNETSVFTGGIKI